MLFAGASPRLTAVGIALIRIVTGFVFAMHGQQKFFEMGVGGVGGFFGSLGIPAPELAAVVVSLVELVGGIALIVGAFTRLAALLLVFDMAVALIVFHAPNGFFVANNGIELVLMLGVTTAGLVLTGAGAYSVDANLPMGRRSGAAPLPTAAR